MTPFKKNDLVTNFYRWDGAGDYGYTQAIVYSCGKKQMVLTDEITGEEMGRNYHPSGVDSFAPAYDLVLSGTAPRMTPEEAEVFCVALSLRYKKMELDRIEKTQASEYPYPKNDYWNARLAKEIAGYNAAPIVHKH